MKCPTCGSENADDAITCRYCGVTLAAGVDDADVDALMSELPTIATLEKERAAREAEQRRLEEEKRAREEAERKAASGVGESDGEGDAEGGELAKTELRDGFIEVRPSADDTASHHVFVVNTRNYDDDARSNDQVADVGTLVSPETGDALQAGRESYAVDRRAEEAARKTRHKRSPILGTLLIVLILVGIGVFMAYVGELWGGKVVPEMVGTSQQSAESALEKKGLKAEVIAEPDDDGIGLVKAQTPDSGMRVEKGSTVTIVVATNRTVPDVVGMTSEEATAELRMAGADKIEVEHEFSSQTEGTVLAVYPEPGSAFVSRNAVTLTVAEPFKVPEVVDKTEEEAKKIIEARGLKATVKYVHAEGLVRMVVDSSPKAGSVIDEGGTVELSVISPYPSDPIHLADYFSCASRDVSKYLGEQGFTFKKGFKDEQSRAFGLYASESLGNLSFSPTPYLTSVTSRGDQPNPLDEDARIVGIRLDFAPAAVPTGNDAFSETALQSLAASCGFSNMTDHIYQQDVIDPPKSSAKSGDSAELEKAKKKAKAAAEALEKLEKENADDAESEEDGESPDAEEETPEEGEEETSEEKKDEEKSKKKEEELKKAREDAKAAEDEVKKLEEEAKAAEEAAKLRVTYACACGEMEDLVWTVIVVGNGSQTRAAATCAPKALYDSTDLSDYGNSICSFVAKQDVYG